MSQKPKPGTAARIDTTELKPSEIMIALKHMIQVNLYNARNGLKRRGVMQWGGPGLGKSALGKQAADSFNYYLLDIRLTTMEPTDLRGIPVPVNLSAKELLVKWAIPSFFPKRWIDPETGKIHRTSKAVDDNGVLRDGFRDPFDDKFYEGVAIMLDELPNAAQSVQAGSYQLVLDGALGEWVAPDNCVVMAAGNRETDRAGTFKMPKPLENRFTHLSIRADYTDWVNNAVNTSYHQDVIGYVSAYKGELYDFSPKSASRAFPTPRSWETVSDIIRGDPNVPDQVMTGLIAGTVGEGIAAKFMEHRKNAAKLPKASDVLDGKVTAMPATDPGSKTSMQFALTTSLCYELRDRYQNHIVPPHKPDAPTRKKFSANVDNFLGFMMREFTPEMVILGSRTAVANFRIMFDPVGMKNWDEFSERYQDMILQA